MSRPPTPQDLPSQDQFQKLIARALEGDEAAQLELSDAVGLLSFRLYRSLHLSHINSEILTEKATSSIISSLPRYRSDVGEFRAWAWTIAANVWRDERRKGSSCGQENLPLIEADGQVGPVADVAALQQDDLPEAGNKIQAVRNAISQLDPEDQILIYAHMGREQAPYEILALERLSEKAAQDPDKVKKEVNRLRQRFKRAKDKLRDILLKDSLFLSLQPVVNVTTGDTEIISHPQS